MALCWCLLDKACFPVLPLGGLKSFLQAAVPEPGVEPASVVSTQTPGDYRQLPPLPD